MVRGDYKVGDSLNRVVTHEYVPATRSDIPKVKSATTINEVEYATTISYNEFFSNKVGDDKGWK